MFSNKQFPTLYAFPASLFGIFFNAKYYEHIHMSNTHYMYMFDSVVCRLFTPENGGFSFIGMKIIS